MLAEKLINSSMKYEKEANLTDAECHFATLKDLHEAIE